MFLYPSLLFEKRTSTIKNIYFMNGKPFSHFFLMQSFEHVCNVVGKLKIPFYQYRFHLYIHLDEAAKLCLLNSYFSSTKSDNLP